MKCFCTIPSFSVSSLPPNKPPSSTNSPQKQAPSVRRPGLPTFGSAQFSKPDENLEPATPLNPLRGFTKPQENDIVKVAESPPAQPHLNKLWLSSKLFPQPQVEVQLTEKESPDASESDADSADSSSDDEILTTPAVREKGKIFVGNLPSWIKKNEIAEFFRQFGPVKNVILIRDHHDPERNVGYCFVIYGGLKADDCAAEAVEIDGVEFHGKCLTVMLDDGRRLRAVAERRGKWVKGGVEGREFRSNWHEEREAASQEFKRILETQPENWQNVLNAFLRIKKPSRRDYGLMVNYYASRGDKHHARCTFESMRAKGIEPNSYVYTKSVFDSIFDAAYILVFESLVHAYAVARDMRGAVSCVEEMEAEGVELNLAIFSILISGYAKIGDPKSAEHWFQEAKRRDVSVNSIIYNNIVNAHCKIGNMERAEALVREMEENGIEAPLDIYHTMMNGYTTVGDESKCLTVFQRLKIRDLLMWLKGVENVSPNSCASPLAIRFLKSDYKFIFQESGMEPSVKSFGCLIHFYTKVGKISKALEVSKEMEAHGIRHNKKTFSMLINGYVQLDDCANAFVIFEDMLRAGFQPDVVTYNIIINAFCKLGNLDRAVRILERMRKERQKPSAQTFTTIIYGYAKSGDMKMALKIVKQMRGCGCIPTVHTFNVLLYGLVQKKQMDNALKIIDDMSLAGVSPNERSYTTIMQGYASVGEIGRAFEYFTKMKNEGLKLDEISYGTLLKACCKAGRMQSALAVTKEMHVVGIKKNAYIYNILIDGWARRGDVWEVADLMQQMIQNGTLPDIHTYTSFINACSKAGDMQRAMTAIEEMKKLGIEPNLKTYTTLIHGWALASHPEKALACFEEMKQVGWEPDEAVYHCLMTSLLSRATFAQSFVYSGILRISKEMVDRGYSVNLGTATYWSKSLRMLERVPSELTSSVEKLYPPNWSSYNHESCDAKYMYSEKNEDDLDMYFDVNKDHVHEEDELQTFSHPC